MRHFDQDKLALQQIFSQLGLTYTLFEVFILFANLFLPTCVHEQSSVKHKTRSQTKVGKKAYATLTPCIFCAKFFCIRSVCVLLFRCVFRECFAHSLCNCAVLTYISLSKACRCWNCNKKGSPFTNELLVVSSTGGGHLMICSYITISVMKLNIFES